MQFSTEDKQRVYEKMFNVTSHERNVNQNHMVVIKKKKCKVLLKMCRNGRDPVTLLVGVQSDAATTENNLEIPQKI